jgi:hypothetical protein
VANDASDPEKDSSETSPASPTKSHFFQQIWLMAVHSFSEDYLSVMQPVMDRLVGWTRSTPSGSKDLQAAVDVIHREATIALSAMPHQGAPTAPD